MATTKCWSYTHVPLQGHVFQSANPNPRRLSEPSASVQTQHPLYFFALFHEEWGEGSQEGPALRPSTSACLLARVTGTCHHPGPAMVGQVCAQASMWHQPHHSATPVTRAGPALSSRHVLHVFHPVRITVSLLFRVSLPTRSPENQPSLRSHHCLLLPLYPILLAH